jgi:hypothetical protein
MLAEWAARAGRLEDLKRAVEARASKPLAEVQARVILSYLGAAGGDVGVARESLEWLDRRLDKDAGLNTSILSLHAALATLDYRESMTEAIALLDHVLRAVNTVNSDRTWIEAMQFELARARLGRSDMAAARKSCDEYVTASARANGDNPHSRHSSLRRIVAACAAACHWAEAWDYLKRSADLERDPNAATSIGLELDRLFAETEAKPAGARFEFLKNFVLPTDPKRPIRLVAIEFTPGATPQSPPSDRGLVNTVGLLIDAARDSGRLDALAEAIKPHVAAKGENAEYLALMVDIARGRAQDAAPRIRQIVARVDNEVKESELQQGPASDADENPTVHEEWTEGLLALACMNAPALRSLGEELADRLVAAPTNRQPAAPLLGPLRSSSAKLKIAREMAVERAIPADLGLPLWWSGSQNSAPGQAEGWVAHEGHLKLVPGSPPRPLRLATPLAGTFELTCDASEGGLLEYGGHLFSPLRPVAAANPETGNPVSARNASKATSDDPVFHRFRLAVTPDRIRCWVDGRLLYESDDTGRSSPWLALVPAGDVNGPLIFRNIRLKGMPISPSEVNLCEGTRLHWGATRLTPLGRRGTIDPGDQDAEDNSESSLNWTTNGVSWSIRWSATTDPPREHWTLKDGTIEGSPIISPDGRPQPSRLSYAYELRDGDSVRYEFMYIPDAVMIHPCFGRRVFVLGPEGVSVRLLNAEDDALLDVAQFESGPVRPSRAHRLPLKAGEWNSLALTVESASVKLVLNGETIHQTSLGRLDDARFGLFHFRDRTAARVRSVILNVAGSRPAMSGVTDLAARPESNSSREDRLLRRAWVGERVLRHNIRAIQEHSRNLPLPDRYDALLAWVLPEGGAFSPRFVGDFEPGDPTAATDGVGRCENESVAVVPAIELVTAAKSLSRLDDLSSKVRKPDGLDWRTDPGRIALEALIALARERDDEASACLGLLRNRFLAASPRAGEPGWPEFVAATAALRRPALRREAAALLDATVSALNETASDTALSLNIRHWADIARVTDSSSEPPASVPTLANWTPSSRVKAATDGAGFPQAFWTCRDGELHHHPGHSDDRLIFASPLLGDFEVTCEVNLAERRALRVAYGGLGVELAPDGKNLRIFSSASSSWTTPVEKPLDLAKLWHTYRLTARAGRCEFAIDGRVIYESRLSCASSPWLTLHAPARSIGGLRNLQITGRPEIPDRVELAGGPDLRGWSAEYFAGTVGFDEAAWLKFGGEIRGRPSPSKQGRNHENILQYERPLAESDSIEYEFEYKPGRLLVHPALDRLVFILDQNGVVVHRLTAAGHDRNDLASDNRTVEPPCRRGPAQLPLRNGEWNRMQIALRGNKVKLQLNGVEIYELSLESTNRRNFGLYYEADQTEARVRGVRLRGTWPGTLPEPGDLMTSQAAAHTPGR